MPVGPSHRRSGGGSFSGGGSRGGSSFGGGFSRGFSSGGDYRPISRGPIRVRWFGGRTVIVSSGRQTGIIAMVIFLAVAIFASFVTFKIKQSCHENINNSKSYISQCELDAEWYKMAKTEADKNIEGDDYFVTYAIYSGQFKYSYNENSPTGYYYDEYTGVELNNVPYYYLIYIYEVPEDKDGDGFNDKYIGETYSSFSSSQASGWDGKIIVGKDGGSWASINYDYSLETNKEYLFEKQLLASNEQTLKTINTAFIVAILASILLAGGLVLVIVNTIKKGKIEFEKEQQKKEAEIAEAKAKSEEAQKRAEQVSRICAYCGSSVPDGAEECPNCGSSKYQ